MESLTVNGKERIARTSAPTVFLALTLACCSPGCSGSSPCVPVGFSVGALPAECAPPEAGASTLVDVDEDGWSSEVDCDDGDPSINPGATEVVCNGIDEDCDPSATPDLVDVDQDGYLCDLDCDDGDQDIYPGAEEVVEDGVDQDCDGVDELLPGTCWDAIPFRWKEHAIDHAAAALVAAPWTDVLAVDSLTIRLWDASEPETSSLVPVQRPESGCGEFEENVWLPDDRDAVLLTDPHWDVGLVAVFQPDGTIYEANRFQDSVDCVEGWVQPDGPPFSACAEGLPRVEWLGAFGSSHITVTQAVRAGELTGTEPIGRSLPVGVDEGLLHYAELSATPGYRWPAVSADGDADQTYTGQNECLVMGSFLTLPEAHDCTSRSTTPGERLCEVMRDHGLVIATLAATPGRVEVPMTQGAIGDLQASGIDPRDAHLSSDSSTQAWVDDLRYLLANAWCLENPDEAWTR